MGKWYEQIQVVGQVNLSEIDAQDCRIAFWEDYWKKTGTQAIVVNCGGIVSYYPSQVPGQKEARFLNGRDIVGEFAKAARRNGIALIARMDISCVETEVAASHPQWAARDKQGRIYTAQGRAVCCVNGPYYREHIPRVLSELCDRYHPEGFADNSWTGLPREKICYCDSCKRGFMEKYGLSLPEKPDYDDPTYRTWITWSYECRTKNWDLFNRTVQQAGGSDVLWVGMVNANFVSGHVAFCDLAQIARRAKLLLVDHQSRDGNGFEQNSFNGLLLHQLTHWRCRIFQSMATYVRGAQAFRHAANPPLEMRLWMNEGFAGGIMPWWHIVGASQQDTRVYERPMESLAWFLDHIRFLKDRRPMADVGILWSQENVEFYGREERVDRNEMAIRGVVRALTREGIPFVPVHADDLEAQSEEIRLLILPEMAVLSDAQAAGIKRFARDGGKILVIGRAGILDETGSARDRSCIEEIVGVRWKSHAIETAFYQSNWDYDQMHSYMTIREAGHPVFTAFTGTDMLPVGAIEHEAECLDGTKTLATFIPPYPIYPPEFSWREKRETSLPALTERRLSGGGLAIAFMWAIDSAYGRLGLPDHGDLLAGCVRYLLEGKPLIKVSADGYIDVTAYRQGKDIVLHLVNLNVQAFPDGYAERCFPVRDLAAHIRAQASSHARAEIISGQGDIKMTMNQEGYTIYLSQLEEQALIRIANAGF